MSLGVVEHELRSEVVHLLAWLNPRHELLVVHALKLCALEVASDAPRTLLLLLVERSKLALGALLLGLEISLHEVLGHDEGHWLAAVEVVGLNRNIINLRTYAERNVRRQCPRSCGPSHEVGLAPLCPLCLGVADEELHSGCEVLNVAVATRLVELVRRKACACAWRIWLYGVALVEQTLIVELLEQPPECLDVLVVVGDIRVVEVDEVAHFLGELAPLGCEHHNVLAALVVVVLSRDVLLRSLVVDILLGDSKLLLHAKLHGESVSVPACLAVNLESLHSLIAVECVLNGACQDVVDARMTVG